MQGTRLNQSIGQALERLERWGVNPWRRYSLLSIILLSGFFLGSSIGMIGGVLALMDPVGALVTVLFLEFMVRIRGNWSSSARSNLPCQLLDSARFGLLYGLLLEGSKLLGG